MLSAGFLGFVYTACHNGWGHSAIGAVPMAVGLGFFAPLIAANVVSEMTSRFAVKTLSGVALLWILAAVAIHYGVPSE